MKTEVVKKHATDVLAKVHSGYRYVTDKKKYGDNDHWTAMKDSDKTGDCDDFAITCRRELQLLDVKDILLIQCWTETKEYHLVCSVGGYVLDNRYPHLMTNTQLTKEGYKWHVAIKEDDTSFKINIAK